jgi:hypothetical protein
LPFRRSIRADRSGDFPDCGCAFCLIIRLTCVLSLVQWWRIYDKYAHAKSVRKVILSGQSGADALHYQEKLVREAIKEVKK